MRHFLPYDKSCRKLVNPSAAYDFSECRMSCVVPQARERSLTDTQHLLNKNILARETLLEAYLARISKRLPTPGLVVPI